MPTRGLRVDYYPMIDITEEYHNSKETRKRKATFEDDDYASGDDTASISINNELTVGKKKTAGSIRDEPCLACVTRGIKTPGHECHNQNNRGRTCWECARISKPCTEIPSQIRDVILEFWAINRHLPSDCVRTRRQTEQSLNIGRAIDNYRAQCRRNTATGTTAFLPVPPYQTEGAEMQTQTTDGAEYRLTAAIQAHTTAVKEQSRLLEKSLAEQAVQTQVLEKILDTMQQAVGQMTDMTNELYDSRQSNRQPSQDDLTDGMHNDEEGESAKPEAKENDWRAEYFKNWNK